MAFDGVHTNSRKYRMLLKPLLWVCHNFRTVAYSRYCSNFELALSNTPFDYLDYDYLQTRRADVDSHMFSKLDYSMHHAARDITIFLYARIIYSGKALEMVSRVPYDSCPFLLARRVAFIFVNDTKDGTDEDTGSDEDIGTDKDIVIDPLTAEANIGSFVERIKQVAPLFIQLARKNALTFQSLVLECRHDIDILGLVQDIGGNHVAYPRLMSLKLCTETDSDETTRPVFHGAAPFPTLRRLHINLDFSFDDDTFFRGNGATLEQLDMQIDSLDASVLRKHKVFVPGSHPRLQSVKLWHTGDFELESFTSPADVMQFMCRIGSGAAVQEYAFFRYIQDQANLLSPLGSHACIQVLSLPNLHPALWNVVALIKSLPLLSDLHTSLPSLGPKPDEIALDELPGQIVSNYAPMGRKFHELGGISRLVDEYAGKYTVVEIIDKIRTLLNLSNRRSYHSSVSLRLAAHPYYQAKLRGVDYNDLTNRIAMEPAAKELDVPNAALDIRAQNFVRKLYSSVWTLVETRKLVDYVQTSNSKPDYAYFSRILGTKNPRQCVAKASYLMRKGGLSRIPTI
ncbi:hypothetical protein GGI17_001676 [Coemansia sp. S146]|nr:hypothetical protein GGI17_001676 [Coemansia sp. S146]